MHARRPKADQHITRRNTGRQQAAAFGSTHGKPGQIIIIRGIHPGHFSRFAAHQGAARLPAALRNTRNHRPRLIQPKLTGREIIQEKQRLSALHHKVIDAHRHQINADRVVNARFEPPMTPVRFVARARGLMASTRASPASISTPASR